MDDQPALDDQSRAQLAELAEVIAPRWGDLPAASEIALSQAPLDRVLALRPDLLAPLKAVLDRVRGRPPEAAMEKLESTDAAGLHTLLTVVAGAYYAHPDVRAALHYSGQQAQSLPRDGFGAEELVIEMMQQPPIYRKVD